MSKTKKIAIEGVLLAIMIVFQTLKNISPYITGPVVNLVLIFVTYYFSLEDGIIFSLLSPITSFIITSNKIMMSVPLVILFVGLGNIVMCLFIRLLKSKNLILNLFVSSTLKGIFMTVSISLIIIPYAVSSGTLPEAAGVVAKATFSLTQFITAYIASVISFFVLKYVKLK